MWINKLKSLSLDIIYPLKCLGCGKPGILICPQCYQKLISLADRPIYQRDMGFKKMIIALDYREYIVKKIIKAFKYPPYIKSLKKVLSSILITAIQKFPNDISYFKKNNFALIPIPLSRLKLAQRGFNQSELLAIELSQKLSLKYQPRLLKKIKNTKSQTNLSAEQRKANVQGVFSVKNNNCPSNIILVDDICTTGATLQAASHALRQAGAKEIWAFVIAKG
ncbi:hypothetical protein B6D52_01705 [Candidatus Parcubacteria bacterium 4484_255]|nr:MAG: hypothetical protein B6D52_01705 [Candidatus Parcubacteria bacterium 4484_255]